jgi:hypothetical protein
LSWNLLDSACARGRSISRVLPVFQIAFCVRFKYCRTSISDGISFQIVTFLSLDTQEFLSWDTKKNRHTHTHARTHTHTHTHTNTYKHHRYIHAST